MTANLTFEPLIKNFRREWSSNQAQFSPIKNPDPDCKCLYKGLSLVATHVEKKISWILSALIFFVLSGECTRRCTLWYFKARNQVHHITGSPPWISRQTKLKNYVSRVSSEIWRRFQAALVPHSQLERTAKKSWSWKIQWSDGVAAHEDIPFWWRCRLERVRTLSGFYQ